MHINLLVYNMLSTPEFVIIKSWFLSCLVALYVNLKNEPHQTRLSKGLKLLYYVFLVVTTGIHLKISCFLKQKIQGKIYFFTLIQVPCFVE